MVYDRNSIQVSQGLIHNLSQSAALTLLHVPQSATIGATIHEEKADQNDVLLKTEFIVDRESVVGAIVDYAEHQKIDIIVIGSRGLSGFKKLLLGSTASGVVTYAHCPVLVVK